MSGQGGGPKSRWGSLLSQAVAGVEARLDAVLAEEDQPKTSASPAPSQQQARNSTTGALITYLFPPPTLGRDMHVLTWTLGFSTPIET